MERFVNDLVIFAPGITYKCKVAEDESYKTALVGSHGWNGQIEAMRRKYVNPNHHNKE